MTEIYIFIIIVLVIIIIGAIIYYLIPAKQLNKLNNLIPSKQLDKLNIPIINYPNSNSNSNNYVNNSNNHSNSNHCNGTLGSDTEEVFHLTDNIFSYDDAQAVCKAYDGRLATLDELIDAYKKGANWCSYGWSEGQLALYPTQKETWDALQNTTKKNQCGKPGVNGGYFNNKEFKFGVNCYGKKPLVKNTEIEKNPMFSKKLNPLNSHAETYKHMIESGNIRVAPFSKDKWFQ